MSDGHPFADALASEPNANALAATLVVEELLRAGAGMFIVAPGSRFLLPVVHVLAIIPTPTVPLSGQEENPRKRILG